MTRGLLTAAIAAAAWLALATAPAAAEPGDIAYDHCLANTAAEGCTDLPFAPLDFATGVAVSPDGKSVYVVSEGSNSVAHFFRDGVTGRLAYDGCLNDDGSNGCVDLPNEPLKQASAVAVSPDGRSVYVTGWGSNTVAHFFRGGADGQISYDGCLGNDGSNGCADMPGAPLSGPRDVSVSPDNKSVYVASYGNGSITHLLRNGPDGQIVFDSCLDNNGTASCTDVPGSPFSGARSVAVSPDNESVYVASSLAGTVSHLFRSKETGRVALDGCLNGNGSNNCGDLPGDPITATSDVAVSPDGKSVYAASHGADSVSHFFRSGPDGQIAYDGCLANDASQGCVDLPGTPITGAWGVAASQDGRSVYTTSFIGKSLAHMLRSGPDGQITWGGCLASNTLGGCGDIPFAPLAQATGVAVSPDGKSVYVASNLTDAIVHFTREPVPAPPEPRPEEKPGGPGPDPGPGQTPDRLAPSITGLAVTNARFRVGAAATPVAAARRVPVGTTFRYTLSEAAAVTAAIQRKRGRRWVKAATLKRAGRQGVNRLRFSGRIGRKKLAAGRYRAVFTATDAGGNRSPAARVRFRVHAR